MDGTRAAGVLLHATSLPGAHGIGDLGSQAYAFVDWLAQAGQRLWQILPLGPIGYGGSPYSSSSAFAGNSHLISLDGLVSQNLLTPDELPAAVPDGPADFQAVEERKTAALHAAFARFQPDSPYQAFLEQSAYWLDDYVRLTSGGDPDAERYQRFVQFVFNQQWKALRAYANEHDVLILGDLPIFVAGGSTDVLARPHLFELDEQARPVVVAGVPPDYFSVTGQRWGNPLYRWEVMAAEGYGWWKNRLRRMLELVDVVRIDHFRGFAAYWAVPATETTAVNGTWKEGPGLQFFHAVEADLGKLPLVVEDLGVITPDVVRLRDTLGYPGMKVLQFGFSGGPRNPNLPHNHLVNSIVYTGTHDNDTTAGWYAALDESQKHTVREYLGTDGVDPAWDLIRAALRSVATYAIIPVQDVLSLGTEAKLNTPGQPSGNWTWRMASGALTDELAERLRTVTERYGRLGMSPAEAAALHGKPDNYPFD